MFRVGKISEELYKLVGLRDPFNPDYAILDADNKTSRSGYYVTDNPFVEIRTIKESQEYKDISDLDFNLYLKRLQQSSIINVCNRVFNRSDYLDRNLLYVYSNNKVAQESLPDGFVGYKIRTSDTKNIAFKIKRVLLEFDTTGDIDLILLHTSNPTTPIQTQTITITDKIQEFVLDWDVDNVDTTHRGCYYLGYIKSGVSPVPFKREYNYADVMSSFAHLSIEKVKVLGHATATMFDMEDEEALSEDIGINPDITVYEDFTDLITQNEMLFARAIMLDMTIEILRTQINSTRSNTEKRQASSNAARIMAEIEGQTGDGVLTITGLRPTLASELSQLAVEINKIKMGYFNNAIRCTTLT